MASKTVLHILVLILVQISITNSENNKRLLLTDPDVLANRLAVLENEIAGLNTKVKQQEEKIRVLETHSDAAITYVVWGRKTCPSNGTELVYSGFAGGGHYTHTGAAVEYVCLPPDPNYDKTSYTGQYQRMYGGEYDSSFFVNHGDGNDVPCSVCRVKGASTALMIPGKNLCYSGWTRQYHGYLASHDYSFSAAASYACMHNDPQLIVGGAHNYEGKLFHPVLSTCGNSALQCPPYIGEYPMTCVVCTK